MSKYINGSGLSGRAKTHSTGLNHTEKKKKSSDPKLEMFKFKINELMLVVQNNSSRKLHFIVGWI